MAITWSWRSYVSGQPEPGYQATNDLNNGSAGDATTHANGKSIAGNSDSDFYTGLPGSTVALGLAGIVDALADIDPGFITQQIQIRATAGTVASGVNPRIDIRIEGLISNVWTVLFPGVGQDPDSDGYGLYSLLGFGGPNATLSLPTEPVLTGLRVRYRITNTIASGLPNLFADLWDIRLIGANCIVPSEPRNFTVTPSREEGGTVKMTLSWVDSINGNVPITYIADQIPDQGGANIEVGRKVSGVDPAPYIVEVTGLLQGEDYCFSVLPFNDCGVGTSTGQVCARLDAVVNPPNDFRGVEECEGNKITLMWELPVEPPDVDGFRIRRDGVLWVTLGPTVQEWVDEAPGINVQHDYSIVAYNAAGESNPATLTKFACEWNGCVDEPTEGTWSVIP